MDQYGHADQRALLFSSVAVALQCRDFVRRNRAPKGKEEKSAIVRDLDILDLVLRDPNDPLYDGNDSTTAVAAILFPSSLFKIAAKFWQHSGEGISSRKSEFFYKAFEEGRLQPRSNLNGTLKGPKRYQRKASIKSVLSNGSAEAEYAINHEGKLKLDGLDYVRFVEERFGRNLDIISASTAKLAIRRRIAGKVAENVDCVEDPVSTDGLGCGSARGVSEDDIYLFPSGMSSIYNTHRMLMKARGELKSIMFGCV